MLAVFWVRKRDESELSWGLIARQRRALFIAEGLYKVGMIYKVEHGEIEEETKEIQAERDKPPQHGRFRQSPMDGTLLKTSNL
jgi:hypothetical protein